MKSSTLVSTFRQHAHVPSGEAIFDLLSVHAKGTGFSLFVCLVLHTIYEILRHLAELGGAT